MNRSATITTFARGVAVALTIGVGAVAVAETAGAQESPSETRPDVVTLQARCLAGVNERLTTLDRLSATIEAAEHLTDGHESTLDTIVAATSARLEAIVPVIENVTTIEELREPCASAVYDNRVYLLVAPQAHLVIGLDTIDAASTLIDDVVVRLDTAIAEAAAAGADVTEAQAHRDAAVVAGEAASSETIGHPDAVLALTPANVNDGSSAPVLAAARATIGSAKTHQQTARTELGAAVDALR